MDKNMNRNMGMDIIRCIALVCVNSVHFFLHSGFYAETVEGCFAFLMMVVRNGFMICVPLFLMLTGYLNTNKVPSLRYYRKLSRTLYVYLAASVICVLYKILVRDVKLSAISVITGLFSFQDAPYGWYLEMYIGLYLLVPFLNILYDSIATQKGRQGLLAALCILTVLPSVLNIFCFEDPAWWRMPSSSSAYAPLVPQWWTTLYPITYFYLGCYLRDYPLKLKPGINVLLILCVCTVAGLFNFYRSYGSVFVWGPWQDYGSFFLTVQTVLVFSLFSQRDYRRVSPKVKKLFAVISDLALGAYLVSWVFDDAFYILLNRFVPDMRMKALCAFVIVPVVFVLSLVVSGAIRFSYSCLRNITARHLPAQKTHIP